MTDGRWAPSYTLLPGGKTALICGGYSYEHGCCVASADIYDEETGEFHRCRGRMIMARDFAPAVPLPDGRVMICGGFNDATGSLWLAEIFDPKTETFSYAPSQMTVPRELFTATPLADGCVLLTGGLCLAVRRTVRSAEIYDPSTGKFTLTGYLHDDRFGQAACRLADGRVLVVGGTSLILGKGGSSRTLSSAEIYDPATGKFAPTGSLITARDRPTASLLPDGRVVVIGGQGAGGAPVTTAEIWDPKTGKFTETAGRPSGVRMAHTAVTLPDGSIVVAGGWDALTKSTTASVERYDPATESFTPLPDLPFASHDAAAVAFPDGRVLIAGGKSVDKGGKASSVDAGAIFSPEK